MVEIYCEMPGPQHITETAVINNVAYKVSWIGYLREFIVADCDPIPLGAVVVHRDREWIVDRTENDAYFGFLIISVHPSPTAVKDLSR